MCVQPNVNAVNVFVQIELINGEILYQHVMAIDNIIISSIHRQIMHIDACNVNILYTSQKL